jgi:hypothetical protein
MILPSELHIMKQGERGHIYSEVMGEPVDLLRAYVEGYRLVIAWV